MTDRALCRLGIHGTSDKFIFWWRENANLLGRLDDDECVREQGAPRATRRGEREMRSQGLTRIEGRDREKG